MNIYIIDYGTKDCRSGVAMVIAENANSASTILKNTGIYSTIGYKIYTIKCTGCASESYEPNIVYKEISSSSGETGPMGPRGPKGADGTMIFSDLTPELKESLKGDRGESGVYIGSGDMPDDCNLLIDPQGNFDILDTITTIDVTKGAYPFIPLNTYKLFLITDGTNYTGGTVVLHDLIGRLVHPSEIALGYHVGAHLGDLLLLANINNKITAKLLTDDEAKEILNNIFTHGLMTSNEKTKLREHGDKITNHDGRIWNLELTKYIYPTRDTFSARSLDELLETGCYAYIWVDNDINIPIGRYDIFVLKTTTPDPNGYYSIMLIATCREGLKANSIYIRNAWVNNNDIILGNWIDITSKSIISEAPNDGKIYGRKWNQDTQEMEWVEISNNL